MNSSTFTHQHEAQRTTKLNKVLTTRTRRTTPERTHRRPDAPLTPFSPFSNVSAHSVSTIDPSLLSHSLLHPVSPSTFGFTLTPTADDRCCTRAALCTNLRTRDYQSIWFSTTWIHYTVVRCLAPRDAQKLYLAVMDPHLIWGCEISPDVDPPLLKFLEDVQYRFIRRCILRVSDTCLTVALFTETVIMLIRYRRLTILKYLIYLLRLDNGRLARAALKDLVDLWVLRKPGWISDIIHVLKSLPFELPPINFNTLSPHDVQTLIDAVDTGVERNLHTSTIKQIPPFRLHMFVPLPNLCSFFCVSSLLAPNLLSLGLLGNLACF